MNTTLHTLRKGPHGNQAFLVAAALVCMAAALAVGLAYPPLWRFAVSAALVVLGTAALLTLLAIGRLRAQLNDAYYAASLYAGLREADWHIEDLFTDGAAANPSLQLFHFKVLRLLKPRRVLELGSGQTTKLLSAYASANPDARVLTLEQDAAWSARIKPTVAHDFRHVAVETTRLSVPAAGLDTATLWYKEVAELREQKFDYVLVDGPYAGTAGGGPVPYARAGILRYMPRLLAESFVVVFDDAERAGESMTVDAFGAVLRASAIPHQRFALHGVKTQVVFCSPTLAFLRSI